MFLRRLRPPRRTTIGVALIQNLPPPTLHRRHISALYVTGDKANQAYVALTPYFDFKARLADGDAAQRLHANIQARRVAHTVDVPQLLQLWSLYRDVQLRKSQLERRRVEIAATLKAMHRSKAGDAGADADLQRKYKSDGALARDDLKRLKENSYAMEDTFVHQFLALPNELHPRTPCDDDDATVLHTAHQPAPTQANGATAGHLRAGASVIEYHDPYCYFLLDEAAEFELAAVEHFVRAFGDAGFVRTSNPDFCRSLLAEAAGLDVDRELLAVLEDGDSDDATANAAADDETSRIDRSHLAGAGSLVGFLGYCAKLVTFRSALPLRLVASGRTYTRRDETAGRNDGLYGVAQSTAVQCFHAAANAADAERLFDETVALLAQTYGQLGRAMRIVQVPAHRLRRAESMRADVELWSAHRGEFVRVADVRYYGEFISKRLLFSYKEAASTTAATSGGRGGTAAVLDDQPRFAHLVGGTALDVSRLLAVMLEERGSSSGADDGGDVGFRVPAFMRI